MTGAAPDWTPAQADWSPAIADWFSADTPDGGSGSGGHRVARFHVRLDIEDDLTAEEQAAVLAVLAARWRR